MRRHLDPKNNTNQTRSPQEVWLDVEGTAKMKMVVQMGSFLCFSCFISNHNRIYNQHQPTISIHFRDHFGIYKVGGQSETVWGFWSPGCVPTLPAFEQLWRSVEPILLDKLIWRWLVVFQGIPHQKLTCQQKTHHWKMYFLLKLGMFQCHVSFQGSNWCAKKCDVFFVCKLRTGIYKLLGNFIMIFFW